MSNLYVLMGPQGAGKGTQAQLLADRFGLPIVATGDILREIAKEETPFGQHVKAVLATGELVERRYSRRGHQEAALSERLRRRLHPRRLPAHLAASASA
jgi:adenylate kinase family enzyme